jgi:hypothetical protein
MQQRKTKKKIVGVPGEAFVLPASRSDEDKLRLAVWASETRQALLEWLEAQHARKAPHATVRRVAAYAHAEHAGRRGKHAWRCGEARELLHE